MLAYENVVGGRLRLKGKALHVKAMALPKTRRRRRHTNTIMPPTPRVKTLGCQVSTDPTEDDIQETDNDGSKANAFEDHLTPAERKFLQQTHELELKRLAKMASKSHRDRIEEFNQYLANLTEHYDVPKVGPG